MRQNTTQNRSKKEVLQKHRWLTLMTVKAGVQNTPTVRAIYPA